MALSDADVGLEPAPGFRIDPLVQKKRDAEADRLKVAEGNGGAGLIRTASIIPGSKAGEFDEKYNTRLSPAEETNFQSWKQRYAPRDSGEDYDLRGAFKAGLKPDPKTQHWPDTFKKPNHETFSNESKYAQYGNPGSWNGETFIPPKNKTVGLSDADVGIEAPKEKPTSGFMSGFGIESVADYKKAFSNESFISNLKKAYDDGSLGEIVTGMSAAKQGPARAPFGENEGGAVTGRVQKGRVNQINQKLSFDEVIKEAKKDPGKFFGQLARSAIIDPELLLLPAAVGVGAKAATGARIIGAGATGAGVNIGVTAAQELGQTGTIDGKKIEQAGAMGFGMGAPFGLLGRAKAAQRTNRVSPVEEPPIQPTGRTDNRSSPFDVREYSRAAGPQESGPASTLYKEFNLNTQAGDNARNATLKAYRILQGKSDGQPYTAAEVDRMRKGDKAFAAELDRLTKEREDAIAAMQDTFQGEHLGPEAERVGPQLESPGPTVTDRDTRGPLAPRPNAPEGRAAPPILGDSPLAIEAQRLLENPIEAQRNLLPDQRSAILKESTSREASSVAEVAQLRQDLFELQQMSGKGSSAKTQEAAAKLAEAEKRLGNWKAVKGLAKGLPDWAKGLGIGAAAYAGAKMNGQDAEDALALGAAALAVKAKGGMWHPKAAEVLSNPLANSLNRDIQQRILPGGNAYGNALALPDLLKAVEPTNAWSAKASQSYLNKHMGTESDPLRDVEIPFGEGTKKWGEVTDSLIKPAKLRDVTAALPENAAELLKSGKLSLDETVWHLPPSESKRYGEATPAASALKSYLSHVGDYLRQNVDPAKLQQYDLVRAVKETARADAELAKKMEKEAADSGKFLPVHKEYPDGFKWVELKLPEKLEGEQRKTVGDMHPEFDDFPALANKGVPRYTPLDAEGKRITNNYTGDSPILRTPEEAWLAGQLAREGNQMGHCVGGYCEGVANGESRIFSLRDPKGKSHVTVEVEPQRVPWDEVYKEMPADFRFKHPRPDEYAPQNRTLGRGDQLPPYAQWQLDMSEHPAMQAKQRELEARFPTQNIAQIKGKQNRAPSKDYLPYVQDFVKGGEWGEVGDLENTGLVQVGPEGTPSPWGEFIKSKGIEPGFITKEEHAKLEAEYAQQRQARYMGGKEQGKIDPRLLFGIAGAGLGMFLADDNPGVGALVGGLLGGVLPTKAVGAKATDLANIADRGLGVLSTRIGNISESLRLKGRQFEMRNFQQAHDYLAKGDPFLVTLNKKLDKETRGRIERAILTGDKAKTEAVLKDIGDPELTEQWRDLQTGLKDLGSKLENEGFIRSQSPEYFPRIVKDLDGLMEAIGKEHAEGLEKVLKDAETTSLKTRKRGLSEVEQSQVINSFLQRKQPLNGRPGYSHGRSIEEITEKLQPFYASPTEAFHSHVRRAVENLETARFFGENLKKTRKEGVEYTNLEDSIGALTQREIDAGRMTYKDADTLRQLLQSRFAAKEAPSGVVQLVKNIMNAGLLGNVVSAATQFGDVATSVYAAGMRPTLKAVVQQVTGNSKIRASDFGLLDHLSEEFTSTTKSAKFLNTTFKAGLFTKVDVFGKDVSLNAFNNKFRKLAQTESGRERLGTQYAEAFGPEFPQLVDDLKSGKRTELTDTLMFSELSDIQPISKMEVPQAYLDNPNGRIMYMLKTFMLKQLDIARRDGWNEIKKGNRAKGIGNLGKLGLALGIAGATTSQIQDWMLGREVQDLEASDIPENILKTFGWSEYMRTKALKEGPLKTAQGIFTPPWRMFDDIVRAKPEAVQYIPLVGKLYYNHYMGGAEKSDAARERARIAKERKEAKGE